MRKRRRPLAQERGHGARARPARKTRARTRSWRTPIAVPRQRAFGIVDLGRRGDEMAQTSGQMIDRIGAMQDFKLYRELHWEGTFEEYLALVRERPQVTRNAYQRLYDMIISFGTEEYIDNKKKLT